jgi:protein O-GlcNAc transferase
LQALGAVEDHGLVDSATQTLAVVAQEREPGIPRPVTLLQVLDGLASDPVDLGYTKIGVALLNMGEDRLAEAALTRALGFSPAYPEATAYLALALARQDKDALGAAEQAVALAPDSPVVQYLAGLVWKEVNRPFYARRHFEAAWKLDPTNPAFAVEIASTHRLEDQDGLAEAWMEEAVKQGNDAYSWRLRLAQFYIDEEYKVEEAGLPLAETLVAEQPDDAEAHATLAWGYFVTGDVQKAFEEMDRALELNPNLARARAHYGALLESQGRLAEAIDNYARALQLDPDGPFGAFAERALERISEQ